VELRGRIRKVLQHHKLTMHGDGVVEADLAAVLGCPVTNGTPTAQTPVPPRLTDEWIYVRGIESSAARAVESEVRQQFGVNDE
jgi:hypothetical protein